MVTTIIQPDTNYASQTILPQGAAYKYDQLNRLIEMKAFINLTNNAFGTTTYNGRYNNRFKYDANGNILSQVRKDQNGITFDSLTYRYNIQNGQKQQNRLYHVNDTVSASVMNDDIDNQGSYNNALTQVNKVNNYKYDQIGNLVRDSAEGIAKIDWTVYGKIKSITHRTGYYKMIATDTVRPPDLVFNYDAAGNRISKIVKPRTATGLKASTYQTMQYYVRDAQGNVLSVYNQRDSTAISTLYFKQTEKHIYGSSRIGIDATQKELIGATFSNDTSNHYLGNKSYELTNHLGNVLTTVSDKKMPLDTNHDNTIDFYVADIRSATDFYPFGSEMKARTWNAGASANGFNGKRKDDEVEGGGNVYDYGARIYDARLGRFMSVDPLTAKYSHYSPYHFAGSTPIIAIDLDGKEDLWSHFKENDDCSVTEVITQTSVTEVQREANKRTMGGAEIPNTGVVYTIEHIDGTKSVRKVGETVTVTAFKDNLLVRHMKKFEQLSVFQKGKAFGEGEGERGRKAFVENGHAVADLMKQGGIFLEPLTVVGNMLDKIITGSEIATNIDQGDYTSAGVRLVTEGVSNDITKQAEKYLPNAKNATQKMVKRAVEYGFDKVIDKGKDKINEKPESKGN